ncbi:MAG TPA: hypothetical protein VGA00_14355 [Acidiferrobacterales bacterium]
MTQLTKTLLAVTLLSAIASFPTQAATISLMPTSQTTVVGGAFTLDVLMDFSDDPTVGGGIDIFYNSSLLQFDTFVFNGALGDDPAFRSTPTVLANELNGLAFGSFTGLSGPAVVGTLSFTALAAGTATLTTADNDTPWGGFISATTGTAQAVTYTGADVTITPIPLPAAVWLMLSGVALIGTHWRRTQQQ